MTQLTRRQLLTFFGATTAAALLDPVAGRFLPGGSRAEAAWLGAFTPVRMPHPLPVYTQRSSFLPSTRQTLPAVTDPSLATYQIIDDVAVAPELEYYVILRWGDRPFPDGDDYVGYNHDYTAFLPFTSGGVSDGMLWVNHEYVSFPFSGLTPETPADLDTEAESPTSFEPVIGFPLPTVKNLELLGEFLYNCGGSFVRIRRGGNGRYAVVGGDARNRRIHGLSGLGVNALRTDGYEDLTAWGTRGHQQGDQDFLVGTGPAATQVFPLSSDGLGNRIIGTAFNCSGATTPWNTVLSGEENFQATSPPPANAFFVGVTEAVDRNGVQTGYLDGTTGKEFGLVGEKYGWMVEANPAAGASKKHTWLGRFRHENAAIRCMAGRRLVLYMGDDRRGGHTWKFVSAGLVSQPKSPANSAPLESGTLHVARFDPNGTGRWIPLLLTTPTGPLSPTVISSVELAALGSVQRNGLIKLPRRIGIGGSLVDGGAFDLDKTNEAVVRPQYQGKTLADFYASQGAVLCDAFLAANLVGGTPCARPEDFELNPRNPAEILLAMTDGAPGSDGYPDSRIFQVAKYSTALNEGQQSGSIHKLIEDAWDGSGTTFRWQRLAQGGEAGAEDGSGFANVDNLTFDPQGDLWAVTDMSTGLHNGFNTGAAGTETTGINHALAGNVSNYVGIFGNNMLFCMPMGGPDAGRVCPAAYGPPRSEFTGPTFVGDTLILSVQHPSENAPFTGDPNPVLQRSIEVLKLSGLETFLQTRTVPKGSNWPSNVEGDPDGPPRSATIGIRRRPGK